MVIDELLRACGFKIHSRQDESEPVWIREGRKYCERHALKIACGMVDEEAHDKYGGERDKYPGARSGAVR